MDNGVPTETPTVFIVDDDAPARSAMESLLDSVGLRVESFGSATDFLARAPAEGPSCLVLDVRLPWMSGIELQRHLASSGVKIPIIFITGHGDIPMSVEAMKAGAVEFLTKPFRGQALLDAIYSAIEIDRTRRQQEAKLQDLRRRVDSLTPRERRR